MSRSRPLKICFLKSAISRWLFQGNIKTPVSSFSIAFNLILLISSYPTERGEKMDLTIVAFKKIGARSIYF